MALMPVEKKDIASTLKREREFFETHPYYHRIVDRLGTSYLQKVLNQQLKQHIREKLPGLQNKTRKRMVMLEKETTDFEKLHPDDPQVMKDVMFEYVYYVIAYEKYMMLRLRKI